MDNPLRVGGLERLGDLLCYGECLNDRQRASCNAIGEGGTLDQFHDERCDTVAFLEPMDDGDIGMAESRKKLGFPLESRETIRVIGHGSRKDLDRNLALEICIGGSIHLAHPANADLDIDFVRADVNALGQRHA